MLRGADRLPLVVPVHEPKFHWASHLIQSTLGSSTSPYLVFSDGGQNVSFSLYLTNCRRSVASVRAFDSFEAVVMTTDTPRVGGIIATKKMAGLRHVFSQTSARYAIALDCEAEVQSHVDVMPLIRRWERDRTIVGWNFSPRYFPFPSMISKRRGFTERACSAVGLASRFLSVNPWFVNAPLFRRTDFDDFDARLQRGDYSENYEHLAYSCYLAGVHDWRVVASEFPLEHAGCAQQRQAAPEHTFLWSRDDCPDRALRFHLDHNNRDVVVFRSSYNQSRIGLPEWRSGTPQCPATGRFR